MSTSSERARRRREADHAYELQVRAASWGAAKYTAIGTSLATLGHFSWPLFRRQTLAFKGFLVSACTIFGLVLGADNALLSHESSQRITETAIRREARMDLARQGRVGTETEIAKWKEERAKEQAAASSQPEQ